MAQKRESLFSQRRKLAKEGKFCCTSPGPEARPSSKQHPENDFGDRSFILSGTYSKEIHEDNIQKLLHMNEEELLLEKQNLISLLHPDTLKFLKNKRNNGLPTVASKDSMEVSGDSKLDPEQISSSQDFFKMEEAGFENSAGVKESDIIKSSSGSNTEIAEVQKLVHKYPHMNVIEEEKLMWIGDLPMDIEAPKDPYPARFNFDGDLLPYSDKGEGVLQGLYNHGDEPERPGYTLQELIQLSRSSVLQQRVISLNTLSKIMANAFRYDECFDEPILPALLEVDMFLLLRFSLDDPAPPIVVASSSALCNLIFNDADEACLDRMLGTPLGLQQPSLGVILEMKPSDIAELKDQQLLKLDIIRGALRTDLLQRIKFILTEMDPEPVQTKQLLKILIRITRHSFEMANNVFEFPGLLEAVRSLLDLKERSPSHYPEALKLFRIISSRSRSFANAIYDKYEIQERIFTIIAGDKAAGHPEAMHLTLESFYTWQTFLSYNIGTESIISLTPVLMRLLDAHYGLINIDSSRMDLEHAAALISILRTVAKHTFHQIRPFIPILVRTALKWSTQFATGTTLNFSASKLIGSCLTFFATIDPNMDLSSELSTVVKNLLIRKCFSKSIHNLRKCSWLIHGKIISSPENLPCLGSISPTVKEESTLPFIFALAAYIEASGDHALKESFVSRIEVLDYIKSVLKGDNITNLTGHWYARQELNILIALVNIFTDAKIRENQEIFHKLAFKLLTSVQIGDKALLPGIISKSIFNKTFLSLDVDAISVKVNDLKLDESRSKIDRHLFLNEALAALPGIEKLYIRELGLERLTVPWPPVTLTGVLNSTQSALPLDWPFLPLLRLHEKEGKGKDAVSIVTRSLQWFIIIEELLPEVFILDYTAKFCRLCCVYLSGNELFQDVRPLLEAALYYILKHQEKIDFESPIAGLTSFYDFYRELLEQFAGVSYGDSVFGQYILLPLQQRHSNKYKKLVWSELAAVLRLLRTPINEVDIDEYLNPCETDADVLRTYLHSLGTGRVRDIWCPVLYRVALHHVSTYARTNKDKLAERLLHMINTMGNKELKHLLLNFNPDTFSI